MTARHVVMVGRALAWSALIAYVITENPRWLAVAGAWALGALGVAAVRRLRAANAYVDDELLDRGGDAYWTDCAMAAQDEIGALSLDEVEARFLEMDRDSATFRAGWQARMRERLCGMPMAQRAAFDRVAAEFEGELDSAWEPPRCTCGVMHGVLTPSRSCPFHGVGAA